MISILMPTYEREDLIGESIRSALAQTHEDFVLLIGDNSESDRTEELVKSIGDPRIRYHRNRPGLGPMGNWCDLVSRTDTPFFATLHDDDTWSPDFLAKAVAPLVEDPEIAMVYCDFWMIDKDGNRRPELTESESARTGRASSPAGRMDYSRADGITLVAVKNAPQPAYAAVVRTAAAKSVDYPDDIDPLYDVWLTYSLVKRQLPLHFLSERLTNYRVHDASETAVSPRFAAAEDAFFTHVLNDNVNLGDDMANTMNEVKSYWAWLRWARATKLMHNPYDRARSQRELSAAAADLANRQRRIIATAAARSAASWHTLRLLLKAKDAIS